MCEKYFFFTVNPLPFFTSTPVIFSEKRRLKTILQKKSVNVEVTARTTIETRNSIHPQKHTNNRNNVLITG